MADVTVAATCDTARGYLEAGNEVQDLDDYGESAAPPRAG